MFGQRRQSLLVNGFESLALRAKGRVESARRPGNRLQARFVQVRFHELAGLVFHETAALFRRNRDQVAVGRADADGVNLQAILRRRFRRNERVAFEILAVGQQDEDFVLARAILQCGLRLANRAGDVGATTGNDGGVERLE